MGHDVDRNLHALHMTDAWMPIQVKVEWGISIERDKAHFEKPAFRLGQKKWFCETKNLPLPTLQFHQA